MKNISLKKIILQDILSLLLTGIILTIIFRATNVYEVYPLLSVLIPIVLIGGVIIEDIIAAIIVTKKVNGCKDIKELQKFSWGEENHFSRLQIQRKANKLLEDGEVAGSHLIYAINLCSHDIKSSAIRLFCSKKNKRYILKALAELNINNLSAKEKQLLDDLLVETITNDMLAKNLTTELSEMLQINHKGILEEIANKYIYNSEEPMDKKIKMVSNIPNKAYREIADISLAKSIQSYLKSLGMTNVFNYWGLENLIIGSQSEKIIRSRFGGADLKTIKEITKFWESFGE